MTTFFREYYWRDGVPHGIGSLDKTEFLDVSNSYSIISDPYRKRLSIEKFQRGAFSSVIYDSCLLDFRHLKPQEQMAWMREIVSEEENSKEALIRDENHRAILLERYIYHEGRCKSCRITSIHGILLCTQSLYFVECGDSFNGLVLFDTENIPVVSKRYSVENGEFINLIEENWNLKAGLGQMKL